MRVSGQRLKVLFLIPTLRGGGSERVVVNLLRHFDRRRFELGLGVVDMRAAAYRDDVPNDIEFLDFGYSRLRYAVPRLVGVLWRRRPDVVFCTLGHLNLTLGLLRPILPRRTRYFARETVVVSELLSGRPLRGILMLAYRFLYRAFDRIVCQSVDMRDDLAGRIGVPPGKLVVIPNPVDIQRIRALAAATGGDLRRAPDAGAIHLVAAGRLAHQKGFDLLIDAIAIRNDPRLRLTILGEGPLLSELEARARQRGIEHQVRFAGFRSNPYSYFAQADYFVLSSRFEGFPNVVLESLACGTPVIATPAPGGVREILEGVEHCRVSERIDAESLAEALAHLVPGLRMPADAADAYAAPRIAARYESLLSTGVLD